MVREGVPIVDATATCALSACSHGNLADDAVALFRELPDLGVQTSPQHRACVVDALARAGRLAEAEQFAEEEGVLNEPVILTTLLGACRIHRDIARAKRFAETLIAQDAQNAVPYVVLANIYKQCGRRAEAEALAVRRKRAGALVVVGRTVTCVDGESVAFGAADFSHPLGDELRAKCREIAQRIGEAGHVADDSWSTHDGRTLQQRAEALCVLQ